MKNKTDRYINSNLFSKLIFYWVFSIFKITKAPTIDSFPKLQLNNKCFNYTKQSFSLFNNQNSLLVTLFKTNKWNITVTLMLTIVTEILVIFNILVFKEYLSTVKNDKYISFIAAKHWLAIIFILLKIVINVLSKQINFISDLRGSKSRFQVVSLIYSKIINNSNNLKEGELIVFIQIDSNRIGSFMEKAITLITIPLQVTIYSVLVFCILKVSYLFGCSILLIILSINFYLQYKYGIMQKYLLKVKDKRMKMSYETIKSIKTIKLFNWQQMFINEIKKVRAKELKVLKSIFKYTNVSNAIMTSCPIILSVTSVYGYKYFSDSFNIEDIITCLFLFDMISDSVKNLPSIISRVFETRVSVKRIQTFLNSNNNTIINFNDFQINQNTSNGYNTTQNYCFNTNNGVTTSNIEMTKNNSISNKTTEQTECLLSNNHTNYNNNNYNFNNNKYNINDFNLKVKNNEFVVIVGNSDKCSLLQCLLNNNNNNLLAETNENNDIAYYSQNVWLQNDTIKNNILFYCGYEQTKYNKVVKVCELETDFVELLKRDETRILKNGVNLSGGQKARISLARAVYADKSIIVLDDPLAALDNIVAQNIVKNCFYDYLKNKTRILITNNYLPFVLKLADKIIEIDNQQITFVGSYQQLLLLPAHNNLLKNNKYIIDTENIETNKIEISSSFSTTTIIRNNLNNKCVNDIITANNSSNSSSNSLVAQNNQQEQEETGSVKFSVYLEYIKRMGGYLIFVLFLFLTISFQTLKLFSDLQLNKWLDAKDVKSNLTNLYIYGGLAITSSIFILLRNIVLTQSVLFCSQYLYENIITNLMFASVNLFHNIVSAGQINNRLSKDFENIDEVTFSKYSLVILYLCTYFATIITCAIIKPITLVFVPFLIVIASLMTKYYIRNSRETARLEMVANSEIIDKVTETIEGVDVIKVFKVQNILLLKFFKKIDTFMKIRLYSIGLSQWFGFYMDMLSISFIIFLMILAFILQDGFRVVEIGLIIKSAISLQANSFNLFSSLASFENYLVYLERCLKYTNLLQEANFIINNNIENNNENIILLKTLLIDNSSKDNDNNLNNKNANSTVVPNTNYNIISKHNIPINNNNNNNKNCTFIENNLLNNKDNNINTDILLKIYNENADDNNDNNNNLLKFNTSNICANTNINNYSSNVDSAGALLNSNSSSSNDNNLSIKHNNNDYNIDSTNKSNDNHINNIETCNDVYNNNSNSEINDKIIINNNSNNISNDNSNKGEIKFKNVSARYSLNTDEVIKNITVEIQAKQRVGVVGRTGSGKSSLFSVLYKFIEVSEGSVEIDGKNIDTFNICELRSSIAVIPQVYNLMFTFRNHIFLKVL